MNGFDYKKLFSLLFVVGMVYAVTRPEQTPRIAYNPTKRRNPTKTKRKSKTKRTSKKSVKKRTLKKTQRKLTKKQTLRKSNKILRVYRNLNTGTLSTQEKVGGSWKVTGHPSSIKLKNAKFKVNEGGRQRVIKSGQKNVHAYVQGEAVGGGRVSGQKVIYDPYKMNSFKAGSKSVKTAKEVSIDSSGNIRAVGIN